jgi:predicted dehydrogenase
MTPASIRRVLVVGRGNIAHRHIRFLRETIPGLEVDVWLPHRSPCIPDPAFDQTFFGEAPDFGGSVDMAIIAGPASTHITCATYLAHARIPLFIEKPLALSLHGIEPLHKLISQENLAVLVGYNFRFYEPFGHIKKLLDSGLLGKVLNVRAEVGKYLPDWRPGMDYRLTATASMERSGGLFFELSHEFDYLYWMLGDIAEVSATAIKSGILELDFVDCAEILLKFKSGCIGSVHMDLIDRAGGRRLRIIGEHGTVVWDSSSHSVITAMGNQPPTTTSFPADSWDQMYRTEITAFLATLGNNLPTSPNIEEGMKTIVIALAAQESIARHTWVSLP